MLIRFTIPGDPISQARPRFTTRGGFVSTYDTKECRNYKKYVRMIALEEAKKCGWISKELPLKMSISVYFEPPKSWSNKKKQAAISGELFHTSKPDVDNLSKIIMDALPDKNLSRKRVDPTSVDPGLYHDDKQIVLLAVRKMYSDTPRVEVVLDTLEHGKKLIGR